MHKWMYMLALVLFSSARSSHAQPSQPVVQYVAPADCPDQAFFESRMRARLRADGRRARPGARLRVQVSLSGSAARGSVRIQQDGSSAQRSLEAGSCKEVVEGLALIAALAIATPPPPTRPSARKDSRSVRTETPAASLADSLSAPPENAVAQPGGSAALAEPGAGAARDATARSAGVTAGQAAAPAPARVETEAKAEEADERLDVDAPPDAAESADDPRLRGVMIDAGFVAIHGPMPHVRPGLQLGAALTLATGALDWRLLFAGRLAWPETSSSAQGTAHFGFVTGVVGLCAAAALGGSWSWDGCAVVEPGLLSWSGENTRNPRDYGRAWLALGAGTGFAVRLSEGVALHTGAELLVPTRRDQAVLAGEVVHHVPPVSLRLQLGLEARPW